MRKRLKTSDPTDRAFKPGTNPPSLAVRGLRDWTGKSPVRAFTDEEITLLRRLKDSFPFRIVWGGINADGEFVYGANHTRAQINNAMRKGCVCSFVRRDTAKA